MLTLELSYYLLKIPNDDCTILSRFGFAVHTQSRVLQADWFIFEVVEKATLNVKGEGNFRNNLS